MAASNSKFSMQNASSAEGAEGAEGAARVRPTARLVVCIWICACCMLPARDARGQIGEPIVEVVIEQEGQPVTDPLVRGLIGTTVGEPLSMRDVRETVEHLTNLRRYDDVQPWTEPVPGGVRVKWVLIPSHPIDRVEFTGRLGVSESD